MRIRITETQAKKLNILKENTDPISLFEQFCATKIQEVNGIYNKLVATNVMDILTMDINMRQVVKHINNIEDSLYNTEKKITNFIESLPEDEYIELENKIYSASKALSHKISSLLLIAMDLEKLQENSQDHNLPEEFSDIKSLDITQ